MAFLQKNIKNWLDIRFGMSIKNKISWMQYFNSSTQQLKELKLTNVILSLVKNCFVFGRVSKCLGLLALLGYSYFNVFVKIGVPLRPNDTIWLRRTVSSLTPSYYPNRCWLVVNWNLYNKLSWNLNRNTKLSFMEMYSKISATEGRPFVHVSMSVSMCFQ